MRLPNEKQIEMFKHNIWESSRRRRRRRDTQPEKRKEQENGVGMEAQALEKGANSGMNSKRRRAGPESGQGKEKPRKRSGLIIKLKTLTEKQLAEGADEKDSDSKDSL